MQLGERYQSRESALAQTLPTDSLQVNQYLDLDQLACQLELPVETLRKLNPSLRTTIVPGYVKNYVLYLPASAKEHLSLQRDSILALAALSPQTLMALEEAWKKALVGEVKIVHRVKKGEALATIARRYTVSLAQIKKWNHLTSNVIHVNQKLVIHKPERAFPPSVVPATQIQLESPSDVVIPTDSLPEDQVKERLVE